MAGEKILVVDDDKGLLTLMRARLEGVGYKVSLAESGEPSRTRSMTNWPGFADAAMSGASMRKYLVTGVSRRVSMIRANSVFSCLEQRVLVHGLEPRPAAVDFGLNRPEDLGVRRREEVAGLAHQLEPVRNRMAAVRSRRGRR